MASQENKVPQSRIDLDTVLVEEVGEFGRFQIFTLLLNVLPIIFAALSTTEYVFTTGRLPTRCLIPECDGATPEFEPAWLGIAVPGSPGNYDECNRFVNISAPAEPLPPDTCLAELFNPEEINNCVQYVHERTDSVVYDFGLECNEWRRTLIGSIRTFGMLLSLPITGFISDRWGRRIALTFNAVNMAWIGMLRAFAPSYEWYILLQTLEATFGGGTYSTCFLLVTEFVGPKYRVIAGPLAPTFFALGGMILGLLAWAVQNWRNLTLIIFIPQFISIGLFWIMPESVRWLLSKGKYNEAEKILSRAARVNKKKLSEKTREVLLTTNLNESYEEIDNDQKEPSLLSQVWRSRVILSRCCVTPVWWIATIMVYYGVSINAVSLGGNRFLNYVYVCAIEIPGYWTAMLILDKIGRKVTLITFYLLCTACQYCFAFITDGHEVLMLILYLLGKYSISVAVSSMYVYTAELYPTNCRHSLFAFSSMIGRIGSIVAPLTPALMIYWEGIPSVLFGSMTLLSALLVLTTPETLGTNLPDTIEEAETLHKI